MVDKIALNAASAKKSLAELVAMIAQNDGDYPTTIPSLTVHRRQMPTAPVHCIYQMGLGVVVQGAKEVMLAGKPTRYRAGESMLTTIDLPVISHVTEASQDEPFLGLMLTLDPRTVVQMAALMPTAKSIREVPLNPLSVEPLDEGLTDALRRLIQLLAEPDLIAHLEPLIQQEIIIRLLASNHGPQLRHLATAGSPSQNISRVVGWLKQNFTRAVCIDELAASAYMSPSTFRQHFRAVTGVSPLQYQKKLRLQEARQQMLSNNLDANSAALIVGYESASQFSREYSREFGESPQRDIKRMRLYGE
ncbi:AraC family transcriptional regulator [Serratia odorifera]|jgi:AraC-like DNA-binding protein|uniref:Transcriptional regulator AraC N-terminal domain protein n=2 Tax=Serratia odorifera TaxID=618 RepID=D4E2X4_SEROD|nr:AraC family transcriptional regulator [Serratia odorifera]EFE95888.1 transcriptional regulator AraC N-terminal domain protein [Serratia odorifera DSM 4582]PNK90482.1 AraC family transcriptional regulator [Serratia odorifera]RII71572.1 AraC family transcriptional regulator [Serratia odorifera]VDZ59407.1 L-rhamnose operon regulatory protein rhaS [Serratia odorifera]HEJ9097504.1 AraC family transcriptional regulator [Serratia odorifera]